MPPLRQPTLKERAYIKNFLDFRPAEAQAFMERRGIDPSFDEGFEVHDFTTDIMGDAVSEVLQGGAAAATGATGPAALAIAPAARSAMAAGFRLLLNNLSKNVDPEGKGVKGGISRSAEDVFNEGLASLIGSTLGGAAVGKGKVLKGDKLVAKMANSFSKDGILGGLFKYTGKKALGLFAALGRTMSRYPSKVLQKLPSLQKDAVRIIEKGQADIAKEYGYNVKDPAIAPYYQDILGQAHGLVKGQIDLDEELINASIVKAGKEGANYFPSNISIPKKLFDKNSRLEDSIFELAEGSKNNMVLVLPSKQKPKAGKAAKATGERPFVYKHILSKEGRLTNKRYKHYLDAPLEGLDAPDVKVPYQRGKSPKKATDPVSEYKDQGYAKIKYDDNVTEPTVRIELDPSKTIGNYTAIKNTLKAVQNNGGRGANELSAILGKTKNKIQEGIDTAPFEVKTPVIKGERTIKNAYDRYVKNIDLKTKVRKKLGGKNPSRLSELSSPDAQKSARQQAISVLERNNDKLRNPSIEELYEQAGDEAFTNVVTDPKAPYRMNETPDALSAAHILEQGPRIAKDAGEAARIAGTANSIQRDPISRAIVGIVNAAADPIHNVFQRGLHGSNAPIPGKWNSGKRAGPGGYSGMAAEFIGDVLNLNNHPNKRSAAGYGNQVFRSLKRYLPKGMATGDGSKSQRDSYDTEDENY